MLRRLSIDNFKTFGTFTVELPSQVLLAGPNGSGKTSLFRVLGALQDLVVNGASIDAVFPESTRTRWSEPLQATQRVTVELVTVADEVYRYELLVQHDDAPGARHRSWIEEEVLELSGARLYSAKRGMVSLFGDEPAAKPRTSFPVDRQRSFLPVLEERVDNQKTLAFRELLRGLWILQPSPFSIVDGRSDGSDWLERDCANFEAWFQASLGEKHAEIGKLIGELRGPLPGLLNVRYARQSDRMLLTFEREGGTYDVTLRELSDGQIVLFVLYALARFELGPNRTFLLDEPDNFLAPAEVDPLLMHLTDLAEACGAQVIVTSHNPYVTNYLAARHGILFERAGGGATSVRDLELPAEMLSAGISASEWIRTQASDDAE